jgi:hypothetical protein
MLKGISGYHLLLTDTGWESLVDVNLSTNIFTLRTEDNKRCIEYLKPKIWSAFPYKGLLTEFILQHRGLSVGDYNEISFYLKSYQPEFLTLTNNHQIIKERKIEWEGVLVDFNFQTSVKIALSDGNDYFLLNI